MKLETLEELFLQQLQDLYSAEIQIIKVLPKMVEAASSPELQQAFQNHLGQTEEHVHRLERIFGQMAEDPEGDKCKGMEGLLKEGAEMMDQNGEPEVIDAGLIADAQRVEHYEISGYGTARTYAELLGQPQIAELLQKTLDEEKQTDQLLTTLATQINVEAKAA